MLLAVGGESRRIVLGEVPPAKSEQEQEVVGSAQDVAAQWQMSEGQARENPNVPAPRVIHSSASGKTSKHAFPVPLPRQNIGKAEDAKNCEMKNRKSRRGRFRVPSGNHPPFHLMCVIVLCWFIGTCLVHLFVSHLLSSRITFLYIIFLVLMEIN